jgi:hypothetical protein
MIRFRPLLLLGLATTAATCATMNSNQKPPSTPSPALAPDAEVRTASDRDHKAGRMVEVFGTYEPIADGKAPGAAHVGHAAVRLEDGTLIHLQPPWHPNAVRSAEELASFSGRAVVAKGMLFAACPPPPDGRAYPKVPCLFSEIVVMERRTYDALHSGMLE